nr:ribonuclease H-like domain-containing protein [Tanacetum cinerariifolium]
MGFDMSKVECYNCHRKGHFARECRSLKDKRRNGAAEPQRRNVLVDSSTSNALVSQGDGVGSYDWSFQAEEKPANYALMAFTSLISSIFENEVVSCSKACTKAYATLQSHYDKLTNEFRKSQFDVISYKTGLESVEARLLVYQQNEFIFEEDIKLLKLKVQFRDNGLVVLRKKFEKAEQERNDLTLKLEKPSTPIIEDWVTDLEDDSKAEIQHNAPSFVQPDEQVKTPRLSVKPLETSIPAATHNTTIPKPKSQGHRRNRKACFVCKNLTHLIKDYDFYEKKMAQTPVRNHAQRGNHHKYASMPLPNLKKHVVPTTLLTKSKLVPIIAARPVTAAVPKPHVTRPRQAKTVVTKPHSPPRRHINHSPSPKASNFSPKVTTAKALMVKAVMSGNPQYALKGKGVIDSGCSRHMTGNMSYLSNFEEINGGCVAFGGNPKGGKIYGKGKIKTGKLDFDDVYFVKELKFNLFTVSQMCDKKNSVLFTDTKCIVFSPKFKLLDENQVLLRVPRENNMYNVDLKNIVLSGDLTCLFAKATLDESNLWHRRLGHINFKTMNKLVKDPLGKFDGKVDEGFLVRYSNTDGDASFEVKEPEFKGRKPQSEVHVSPSSSALIDGFQHHDENTKREAKGKSPVESSTGYRNLSAEFEDFSDNSINEVNATDSPVPAVGQILSNSTNTFSAVGPSNATVSPTHGKYSYVDTSQLPDDLNMPELEDITYSDDEEDVGAEADFTNLEKTITVSPIPTTRVHKDHHVTQIIGDLSSATQTMSMTRVAKDQGGLSQINNDDFHTCMFACFLLQKEPKMEEGINYEEVFAPVARIEAIRLFLAYASFMGSMVYQMDVKSAFLYGTIEKEVYVCQPLGFEDPDYPGKVYKVVKALYGLHQALRAWKFGLTYGKSASTPIDTEKPLLKDPDGEDLDVHTYRSMIGSLIYLTLSRPDIMFAVCACARIQVTPKASHLHAVKRIFRYLKGKPHLGLWYPKDSPFNLVAYSDSDYAGASLDRKSTTRGVNFLDVD